MEKNIFFQIVLFAVAQEAVGVHHTTVAGRPIVVVAVVVDGIIAITITETTITITETIIITKIIATGGIDLAE